MKGNESEKGVGPRGAGKYTKEGVGLIDTGRANGGGKHQFCKKR